MTLRIRVLASAALCCALVLGGCTQEGSLSDGGESLVPERDDLSAGTSDPVTDPMYPEFGHANIDVLHYGVDLEYIPDTKTLSGTVTLTIRPIEDSPELALDFSDAMSIEKVTVDSADADFTMREYDLTIDTELSTDEQIEVAVTYSGTPELVEAPAERGDMSTGIGASVDPETGALWSFQEPFGALTWYPVNDHPSDEALYDFAITVPEGYSGVASGTFKGQEDNTFLWSASDPVASYLTTIAVDEYEMTEMSGPNGLPITTWVPQQYERFVPILEQLPDMITWLEDNYGPYPFESAGVVLVGGESAMETQQMVTFSGGMADIPGVEDEYIAGVVVHELAHQWFGNAVTPQDWTGLWLNEGAATYAEQMWNVEVGYVTESAVVSGWESDDAALRREYGPPGDPDPGAFASSNSYVCPALMLYNLRDELDGEAAVNELLAAWVVEFDNQSVTREDFIGFANEHTGEDLTEFFDEWLDSATTPR